MYFEIGIRRRVGKTVRLFCKRKHRTVFFCGLSTLEKVKEVMLMAIVVYFSHTSENYVEGDIRELKVGNTAVAAAKMAEQLGISAVEIKPAIPYPKGYQETVDAAKKEKKENARPNYEIAEVDWREHQEILLGYPIWWGTFPMVVAAFLEANDFSGKDIYPFCTHEGSGLGSSVADVRALCPDSQVHPGLSIRGSKAGKADKIIKNWLTQLAIGRSPK